MTLKQLRQLLLSAPPVSSYGSTVAIRIVDAVAGVKALDAVLAMAKKTYPSSEHVGFDAGIKVGGTRHRQSRATEYAPLLPCPFCGTTNMDTCNESGVFPHNRDDSWVARCGNPDCAADVIGESIDDARARWNRRVTPP